MLPTKFESTQRKISNQFIVAIAALCLAYLAFEILYIPHSSLEVDEFWFAHHIYIFTKQLPYRDFPPYKTVLGYYLLTIPMFFSHVIVTTLYYIKDEIAIINTIFIAATALWAARFFRPSAVLLSLVIIMASQLFLIYSADLRIDMLASWLGLISLLLILSNRFFLAGIILGISFLISQKALWFVMASDVAMACYWLFASRHWQTIRATIFLNLAVFIPIVIYSLFWSALSSPSIVWHSVFYEAYTQSKITWYSRVYFDCWKTILFNGPLLVLLWPLTWISLFFTTSVTEKKRRIFIISYSSAMMLLILSYQQTFPYNMVFFVPVFFLLFADFFSWLNALFEKKLSVTLNSRILFWFISLYAIGMLGILISLGLPNGYLLAPLFPICLALLITYPTKLTEVCSLLIWLIVCTCGIFYPFARFTLVAYAINNHFQEKMIITANKLLKEGGGYIGGTPFIFDKDQPIAGLRNLISPTIDYLYKPSSELLPIMIKSLYLEPRTNAQVIADLNNTPVKLFLNNCRMIALPGSIRSNLHNQFEHFWGSIYLYAPLIFKQQHTALIKFTGNYLVEADASARIMLDNKIVQPKSQITLSAGNHLSDANMDYRLKLVPKIKLDLDPEMQDDEWIRMLKPVMT